MELRTEMSDSAQIIKPFGEFKTPGVDQDVVELLEQALERAKNGELIAIAIAAYTENHRAWSAYRKGKAGIIALLGCVDYLKDDILSLGRE